jgi:enoyl-CoA hydratase
MPADSLVRAQVVDGDVAVLTLADPERRNALTLEMTDDLAASVAWALAEDVGAIVLAADPPVFCAGGSVDDLFEPRADLPDMYAGFLALATAPVLTIAAVDGATIGAGVNLPLACDVVFASPAARFDPRFLDLGLHPGGGHLWRLERRVGRQAAAALVLGGDVLDGVEAEAKGLAWRCVPSDDLLDAALVMARRAAGRPARRWPGPRPPSTRPPGWPPQPTPSPSSSTPSDGRWPDPSSPNGSTTSVAGSAADSAAGPPDAGQPDVGYRLS